MTAGPAWLEEALELRVAERRAAAVRRAADRKAERAVRLAARRAGLALRHARKINRTEERS